MQPLIVFAAGSLKAAMAEVEAAFTADTGIALTRRHGPAGIMAGHVEAGEHADLFMSADYGYPAHLHAIGLGRAPILFARNRFMAMARRGSGISAHNFIARLLDPAVRIGTSTPLKDAGGDYAWALFRNVERLHPGAFAELSARARQLVGASEVPTYPPPGPIASGMRDGTLDLAFGYLSNLRSYSGDTPVDIIEIPAEIAVLPEYAMIITRRADARTAQLAAFVMSTAGQSILADFGFSPVALPVASQG